MLQHYQNLSSVDGKSAPDINLQHYDLNMPRYNAPKYTSEEALYGVLHKKFSNINKADFKIKVGLLSRTLVC
jgi:hypothetical protein